MKTVIPWLLRVGEVIAALGIIGGAFAGIIALFGGQIPPWFTPTEAAAMQQQLTKVSNAFDNLTKEIDRKECLDYKDRLDRATMKLAIAPSDLTAELLARSAREKIGQIPNCQL